MFAFKSCAKCGGDMYLEPEPDGYAICCLQCGYRQYLANIEDPVKAQAVFGTLVTMRNRYASANTAERAVGELVNV